MKGSYIKAETFEDFKDNQNKLINILNHNMTAITVDIKWLKKIMGWQIILIATITATVIVGFLKISFFG